jgi:hypothetical protein
MEIFLVLTCYSKFCLRVDVCSNFFCSDWLRQPIQNTKIVFLYRLITSVDTKNKSSFFISAIVISSYQK